MKTRLFFAACAATGLFVLMLWVNRRFTQSLPVRAPQSARAVPSPAPVEPPSDPVGPASPASSPAEPPSGPVTPQVVQTEMETVKFFIRDFRAALGENPVGNNAEITKALLGANPTKTKFVVPGDSHVSAAGELIDPWGTPYFFHALSARDMEIRSAGPDRRMWTADDIVLR